MMQKINMSQLKKRINTLLYTLLNDERGQSTTEYILILSVVVIVAMKFKEKFQSTLVSAVGKLGGNIDKALEDGQ